MNRKVRILLFILLLLLLGFFRETLFVSINSALYDKFYNTNNHRVVWFLSFLTFFSYKTIYISKWFISPFFVFIYWYTQRRFLLFLFNEKRITHWLTILYLSLFLLAGVFFMTGWAFGKI